MPVAPPRPKSLPLNALRAFEAAARLGGFSAAAEELGVTAGAISAHVKAIEDELGAPLFERTAKGVRLTALGARAQPGFSAVFDDLGAAVQNLRAEAAPRVVHIAALPALAQFWLSPRLPELRRVAPEIEISVTALETPPNLKRIPYDLCLFYAEDEPGAASVSEDWLLPVCAPEVAARLTSVRDLQGVPCLSDSAWSDDWATWAAQAMPEPGFAPRGPVYSLYSLAVAETVNGAGVLMGHKALLSPYLESGELVAPFTPEVRVAHDICLWGTKQQKPQSPVAKVAAWLKGSG